MFCDQIIEGDAALGLVGLHGFADFTNDIVTLLGIGGTKLLHAPFFAHAGEFSNGITTAMCMYAPEFSSHSEGVRFKVEGE